MSSLDGSLFDVDFLVDEFSQLGDLGFNIGQQGTNPALFISRGQGHEHAAKIRKVHHVARPLPSARTEAWSRKYFAVKACAR